MDQFGTLEDQVSSETGQLELVRSDFLIVMDLCGVINLLFLVGISLLVIVDQFNPRLSLFFFLTILGYLLVSQLLVSLIGLYDDLDKDQEKENCDD